MGNCTRSHVRPRVVEIDTPPSLATAMRLAFVGSIHMSWLSPPGEANGTTTVVSPPRFAAATAPPGTPGAPLGAEAPRAARPPPRVVRPPSSERLKLAQRKY